MANFIKDIILTGAGVETSNGVYTRESGGNTWFYSENGSRIEPTVDGWFLIDKIVDDQTYMFDHNFQTVISVGDCINPVPSFELVYSED
jgi:hypothetical protein